ncbi:MAG: flippase-like domain-containing protein [Prevotella sp.]|nr:flippase-like domain-containing protein [Prevotella sp.]MCM1075085.1 flippase-like domain-containing protein [Ruminococcus sp.]
MNTDREIRMTEEQEDKKTRRQFALWKILLPVAIGIAVVVWMFVRDAKSSDIEALWAKIQFSPHVIVCLIFGWLFMCGRDFGLSWRFRLLTDKELKWKQAIRVNFLCEFTSAVTPSTVGGSSFGMIYLNREGIELGRATTLMLTTLFLDELYLVVMAPLFVMLTPSGELFTMSNQVFGTGLEVAFWLIYTGIVLWTLFLFCGIILYPNGIRRLLLTLFSIRFLRRWKNRVEAMGDNMVATSAILRKKPVIFWIRVFGATVISWLSRYMVVNALFLAFVTSSLPEQWIILARQFIVWVLLIVSPTPGGSGISEWLFTEVYGSMIPTVALALFMAICWRIISYYIYLIIGMSILPKWLRDSFSKKQK